MHFSLRWKGLERICISTHTGDYRFEKLVKKVVCIWYSVSTSAVVLCPHNYSSDHPPLFPLYLIVGRIGALIISLCCSYWFDYVLTLDVQQNRRVYGWFECGVMRYTENRCIVVCPLNTIQTGVTPSHSVCCHIIVIPIGCDVQGDAGSVVCYKSWIHRLRKHEEPFNCRWWISAFDHACELKF